MSIFKNRLIPLLAWLLAASFALAHTQNMQHSENLNVSDQTGTFNQLVLAPGSASDSMIGYEPLNYEFTKARISTFIVEHDHRILEYLSQNVAREKTNGADRIGVTVNNKTSPEMIRLATVLELFRDNYWNQDAQSPELAHVLLSRGFSEEKLPQLEQLLSLDFPLGDYRLSEWERGQQWVRSVFEGMDEQSGRVLFHVLLELINRGDLTVTYWAPNPSQARLKSGSIKISLHGIMVFPPAPDSCRVRITARTTASNSTMYDDLVGVTVNGSAFINNINLLPAYQTASAFGSTSLFSFDGEWLLLYGQHFAGGFVKDSFVSETVSCIDTTCPLVIDLDGDGFSFGNARNSVSFDMMGTGDTTQMQWVRKNNNDAFLARDINGNGLVDNGSELFGSGTVISSLNEYAANGFVALSQFDLIESGGNNDGMISSEDSIWAELLLWIDANANGMSDLGEMTPISASEIDSIGIIPWEKVQRDANGNILRYFSLAEDHEDKAYQVVDVYFRPVELFEKETDKLDHNDSGSEKFDK